MMKKFIAGMVLATVLSGCGANETPETILESTVKTEEGFAKHQQELKKLEEEESQLFKKMMDTEAKDKNELKQLAEKAEVNLAEREQEIDAEQETMKAASEEMDKIKEVEKSVEHQKQRKHLADLQEAMGARYKEHKKIVALYKDGLQLNQELYKVLKNGEAKLSDAQEKIDEINKIDEKLSASHELFNSYSKKVNENREKFIQADS